MNECELCKIEIAGWQTFGSVGSSLCWQCFKDTDEDYFTRSWYGLAPHHHNMTRTGSIIGSTVLDDLSAYYEWDDGWYEIKPNLFFMPDEDVPGLGIWENRNS